MSDCQWSRQVLGNENLLKAFAKLFDYTKLRFKLDSGLFTATSTIKTLTRKPEKLTRMSNIVPIKKRNVIVAHFILYTEVWHY